MKPLESLINICRRETENEDLGVEAGIADVEFIDFFNMAQERLQSVILEAKVQPVPFAEEEFIDVVANQAEYDMPDQAFYKNRVINLEFSRSGNLDSFSPLRPKSLRDRNSFANPEVDGYILRNGQFILDPIPSTSTTSGIRLNYMKALNRLDIKRFKVLSVTLDSGTNTITSLVLENNDGVAADLDQVKHDVLTEDVFMSVINPLGEFQMKNIQFDNIGIADGVVTVNSAFTYETGESIAVGDFITAGKFATNRITELPEEVIRYLISYVNWKIFKRDSSQDATAAGQELQILEQDIIANYMIITDDLELVPIIDESFLN